MVFPTFFNLSINLAIRIHDQSHSQLPILLLLTVYSFSIFGCKEYNQSDFCIDHLMMSLCRAVSRAVGRGCLLELVHSLGKPLPCFILYCKAIFACYSRYFLTSYFFISSLCISIFKVSKSYRQHIIGLWFFFDPFWQSFRYIFIPLTFKRTSDMTV